MKRFKAMGLCLVAMFAISLVGVASASAAEPEFGICKKQAGAATHEYTDAACQNLSGGGNTGKYQWLPGPNGTKGNFTAKTGAAALYTKGIGKVECAASSSKGKTLNTNETEVTGLEFTGCKSNGESCKGQAVGNEAAGDIETYALGGKLGYINNAGDADEVGNVLKGKGPGGLFAKFICGPVEIKTYGAVIGKASGTIVDKKPPATHTELFEVVGEQQVPQNFEGGPKQTLETEFSVAGTTKFESAQEATATVKGKLEIKA